MIKTKFHDIFQTKFSIIQAGMGPYDTTKLAGAVAKAGGVGMISTVGMGSFEVPGIGQFRYSAIFGEATPEELLTRSINHVMAAIKGAPWARFGVNIPVSEEILDLEIGGLTNLFQGKIDETPVLGGTVAGRIHDIPSVQELCDRIMKEAEATIRSLESLIV